MMNKSEGSESETMRFNTNPLPGMNPWLESYWGDIHTKLTTYACDVMQQQLPRDLQARVEEYLSVFEAEEDSATSRRIAPDVQIVEQPGMSTTAIAVATKEFLSTESVIIRRRAPPQTLRYIKIVDVKSNRRVVTAIEFISLANKATEKGRQQYFAKQRELISAGVNLVEVDLLRSGGWVMAAQRDGYPPHMHGPYRISVVRATSPEDAEIYRATFRTPLPTVRVPLRETDNDIELPLQQILNSAYENGRYGNDVDYSVMPDPVLDSKDFEWISNHLNRS